MSEDSYELASKIEEHESVSDVRADKRRIEVFQTVEKGTEEMSTDVMEHVKDVLDGSLFEPETGGWVDQKGVSRHTKSGGVFNNPTSSGGSNQLRKSYVV